MTLLHLEIERTEDLALLLPLLDRLGIQWTESQALPAKPAAQDRNHLLSVIESGGDGLSFGDAMAWQREQRRDRTLPGRE